MDDAENEGGETPRAMIEKLLGAGIIEVKPDGLDELLGRLKSLAERASRTPAEKLALIRSFAANYGDTCPFKVGDVVTPRVESPYHGDGEPSVVVDVMVDLAPDWKAGGNDPASPEYGAVVDMRVLHLGPTGIAHCHWVESWGYERWVEPPAPPAEDVLGDQF